MTLFFPRPLRNELMQNLTKLTHTPSVPFSERPPDTDMGEQVNPTLTHPHPSPPTPLPPLQPAVRSPFLGFAFSIRGGERGGTGSRRVQHAFHGGRWLGKEDICVSMCLGYAYMYSDVCIYVPECMHVCMKMTSTHIYTSVSVSWLCI